MTAPVTGAFSGAIPLKTTSLPGLGIGGQILNDTAGSLGTGELVSYATEGRGMNRAEFVAASLNIGPSVLQHVAIHPMMARAQARAEAAAAARDGGPTARPVADVDADGAAPGVHRVDDDLATTSDPAAGRPVVLDAALPTRANDVVAGVPVDDVAAAPASTAPVATATPAAAHAPASPRATSASPEPVVDATVPVDFGLDLSPLDTAVDATSDAAAEHAGGSPAATARQEARRTRAAARTERDLQAVDANRREPLRSSRSAGANPAGVPARGEEPRPRRCTPAAARPCAWTTTAGRSTWIRSARKGSARWSARCMRPAASSATWPTSCTRTKRRGSGAYVDGLDDVRYADDPQADPARQPVAYDTLDEALAAARPGHGPGSDRIAFVPHAMLADGDSVDVPGRASPRKAPSPVARARRR